MAGWPTKIRELFGRPAKTGKGNWRQIVAQQDCPFRDGPCDKNRKSEPSLMIGTCTVAYGKDGGPVVICPHRFLEKRQTFADCLHLLTNHQPGNELHIIPEISIPGGSVDYFLTSVRRGKPMDFVGIEFQTMDTTGTVWPERQRFLDAAGEKVESRDTDSNKPFGINWKHTAKTILVQLHHKVETFEHVNKHFVLVLQDCLFDYMSKEFTFGHMSEDARLGDPMHFHIYQACARDKGTQLELVRRVSTDTAGIAKALDLQASPNLPLEEIMNLLAARISDETRVSIV